MGRCTDSHRRRFERTSGTLKAVLAFLIARPLIAVALAATVVGIIYLHARRQKTPVTHRSERVGLTDAQQMQLGSQEYAKTLRANRARIVSLGAGSTPRCSASRGASRPLPSRDKPDFVWRVTLIRKNEANAFCLPGGKIVVYTGILPLTRERRRARDGARARGRPCDGRARRRTDRAQSPDRGRGRDHRGRRRFTPGQFVRVTALLGVGPASCRSAARRSPRRITSAWSTWRERATTRIRQSRSGSACSGHRTGKEPPEFLSDHPSDAHRVQRVRGWLPEAEREYKAPQAGCGPFGGGWRRVARSGCALRFPATAGRAAPLRSVTWFPGVWAPSGHPRTCR